MTYTSTEDTEDMRLVSKRRKDMAAWAVENFKTWPKPHELTDVDPEEIGCELVVLNQHHLPVLRCKLGGGYVDSTTWFYAKRNPKKMTQAQQPEALRLARKFEEVGFMGDHRFAKDHWCRQAAAELRLQHARIEELEAQLSATQPAAQGLDARDAAFEAVRKAFCNLQRYSFWLDSRGNVRRCADRSGNWVEFEAAHTLFEPQSVDAALAAKANQGGM